METQWKLILSDTDSVRLRLMQSVLEGEGIAASLIDKTDSELPSGAESELYVPSDAVDKAKEILAAYSS
jgi:hypothetical protein